MFFRRKGWLREEFDEKLIKQFSDLKEELGSSKCLTGKKF